MPKLTDATVKSIAHDATQRLEVPDSLVTGLYLILQPLPSNKKSWAVRYRAEGRPVKQTIGGYPTHSLANARDEAKIILQKVAKGENPAAAAKIAKRRAQDGEGTVNNLARQFLKRHAQRNNRSWREPMRQLGLEHDKKLEKPSDDPATFVIKHDSFLARHGHRQVADIKKSDIIALIDDIVDAGKPIAANRTLAAIRRFFSWCVERDLIASSPADRVKAPSEERSRDRVLSDSELGYVMKAADAIGWPFGPMMKVLALTGQRRNEVAGMRWSEIDLVAKVWVIPRERAKNDTEHSVPLSDAVIAILEAAPRVEGWDLIFTTKGTTAVSGFSRAKAILDAKVIALMKADAEKRGDDVEKVTLTDWRVHDLRRSTASGMARLGIRLEVIEKVLNHLSGSFAGIVGVYQRHSYDDEKRAALTAWASFVTSLTEEKPSNVVPIVGRVA